MHYTNGLPDATYRYTVKSFHSYACVYSRGTLARSRDAIRRGAAWLRSSACSKCGNAATSRCLSLTHHTCHCHCLSLSVDTVDAVMGSRLSDSYFSFFSTGCFFRCFCLRQQCLQTSCMVLYL